MWVVRVEEPLRRKVFQLASGAAATDTRQLPEGDALLVETTQFTFDITGFDDYNGIPSSQLKKVTERYWREGDELRLTLTVEDPLFLREPASYTTRWLPAGEGSKLNPYECDAEDARRAVKFMVPKYR